MCCSAALMPGGQTRSYRESGARGMRLIGRERGRRRCLLFVRYAARGASSCPVSDPATGRVQGLWGRLRAPLTVPEWGAVCAFGKEHVTRASNFDTGEQDAT